jgi:hypothetical protein
LTRHFALAGEGSVGTYFVDDVAQLRLDGAGMLGIAALTPTYNGARNP